jgi:hypothetical protein
MVGAVTEKLVAGEPMTTLTAPLEVLFRVGSKHLHATSPFQS